MSLLTKVEADVAAFETKVFAVLRSNAAKTFALEAASLVEEALPIVEEFAGTAYVPEKVAIVLAKYGEPVAAGLLNGTITVESEVKSLVGLAVSSILARTKNVRTTVANIARDLAFLEVQPA